MQFPHNFFWGAATSAYQVEGNNQNADWWEWEKKVGLRELSGTACCHYERYEQDFDLAGELNHNAHRLSLEWSRIQPQKEIFNHKEIEHYLKVISALRLRNIEPVVTLHHFTNPIWFAALGGWENPNACGYFLAYLNKIVPLLCDKVKYWVTINEPMVYIYQAYLKGNWPPQKKTFFKANAVINNFIRSHIDAYRLIHKIYKEKNFALPYISLAQSMQAFVPLRPTLRNKLAVYLKDRYFNFNFIDTLVRYKTLDFIGINYYTRGVVDAGNRNIKSTLPQNSLGWDIYPQGLYSLLIRLKRYNLPVFILENGISTGDDKLRWEFICGHLKSTYRAISGGVNVIGYLYWSLLDNYEWDKGFSPRFGLIEVDYATYKRTVRESARKFAVVCKTGIL